jgi:hypothetical protein
LLKKRIKVDLSGLETFSKAVKDMPKKETQIGILGKDGSAEHSDSGKTNATIGVIHEMGSINGKIPQRSFLKMPIEERGQDITDLMLEQDEAIMKALSLGDTSLLYEYLGLFSEVQVQEAFNTGGFGKWQKLAESTIKKKGSSAILIDTAQLRKSITYRVRGKK